MYLFGYFSLCLEISLSVIISPLIPFHSGIQTYGLDVCGLCDLVVVEEYKDPQSMCHLLRFFTDLSFRVIGRAISWNCDY